MNEINPRIHRIILISNRQSLATTGSQQQSPTIRQSRQLTPTLATPFQYSQTFTDSCLPSQPPLSLRYHPYDLN